MEAEKIYLGLLAAMDVFLSKLDQLTDESGLKLAVVCMIIDHICETHKLSKNETVKDITKVIPEVNAELGPLYHTVTEVKENEQDGSEETA